MCVSSKIKIGNVILKSRLVLAPMAGITNMAFRLIAKEFGAALVHTEMISAKGLCYGQKRTYEYLVHRKEEKPISMQIFGSEPEIMSDAAQILVEHGADIIDINMGCPVKKVTKTGAGASLLKDLKKAEKVIKAVRKACSVPLTVKIRAGWSPEKPVFLELLKIAEENGVNAVTIHARYAIQGYDVKADWNIIKKAKENSDVIIIGNGDVFSFEDAKRMFRDTGCDIVMIARGAIGNPWIFKNQTPTLSERKTVILRHLSIVRELMRKKQALGPLKAILIWYSKGLPYSSTFREKVGSAKSEEELICLLNSYFSLLKERTDGNKSG